MPIIEQTLSRYLCQSGILRMLGGQFGGLACTRVLPRTQESKGRSLYARKDPAREREAPGWLEGG
jgi:hypothetical protein